MARTRIEELVFKLNADSAQLRRELGLVEKRGDLTATKLRSSFQGLAFAFRGLVPALSGVALVGAAREAIAYGDAIEKAAQKTTFSVEALQELRFAGQDAAGLGSSQVDTALQRFSRRIGEAAVGTGVLKKEIERYGIELRDSEGNLRSSEDILRDYADVVASAESGQEQLRLAVQAFDQEGGVLVNVLRQGSSGLDDFAQAAREAGAVLDKEAVERLSEMQSRLDRVGASLKTLGATFTANLAESLGLGDSDLQQLGDAVAELGQLQAEQEALLDRRDRIAGQRAGDLGFFDFLRAAIQGEEGITADLEANVARQEELQQRIASLRARIGNEAGAVTPAGDGASDETIRLRDQEQRQADALIETLQRRAFVEARTRREAIEGARLEADQQQRLLDALDRGEDAYRRTAIAIEVENEARRLGIDLQSEDIDAIEKSILLREELQQRLRDLSRTSRDEFDTIREAGEDAASSLSDAFADFVTGAEFDLDRLARSIFSRFLSNEFESVLGGVFGFLPGGSILGGLLGAGKAHGGRVMPGSVYPVGEQGPELFVPDVAGQIVNFTKAASAATGGGDVNVQIVNTAANDVSVTAERTGPTERDLRILVARTVNDNIRNGAHDAALSRRFGARPIGT